MNWWLFLGLASLITIGVAFIVRTYLFLPDLVFIDKGEKVSINKNPTRLNINKIEPVVVLKSSICKIQMASNVVTLFNTSNNAIDIPIPNKRSTKIVFENTQKYFEEAEVVETHS